MSDSIVAAEVRRADHFDRQLVSFGQGEKASRRLHEVAQQCGFDAVAGDIEKTQAVGGGAQFLQKYHTRCFPGVEPAKVELGNSIIGSGGAH